jgi:hypothetical protein
VLVAALMALHVAAALGSGGTYDTVRDIFHARAIATGSEWPSTGPAISTIFHLGPVWYWILAPGWAIGGMPGVVALIGLLSGLKFPFAWLLGRRIGGARMAALLVIGIAMPGWAFFETALLTHVAVVQASLLATLLAALRCRRTGRSRDAGLLGLCAGLAFHAHPSSLLLAGAVAAWGAWSSVPGDGAHSARRIAVVVAVAALPWIPYLFDQLRGGFPDRGGVEAYATALGEHSILARLSGLLRAIAVGGFEAMSMTAWRLDGATRGAALAAYIAAWLAAACGLALALRRVPAIRAVAAACVAAILAQAAFLLAIRDITPVWMVFAFGVPMAVLFALGCEGLARGWPGKALVSAIAGVIAAANIAALPGLRGAPVDESWLPAPPAGGMGLMDVIERPVGIERVVVPRPTWTDLGRLAEPLCAPSVVHGHYASFVDATHTVALSQACGAFDHVQLGGAVREGWQAFLGLSPRAAAAAGRHPDELIGGLAVFRGYRVVHGGTGLAPVEPRSHPARALHGRITKERYTVRLRGDDSLVVAQIANGYFGTARIVVAWVDADRTPVYADATVNVYRCASCAADEVFDVRVSGEAAWDYVDLIVLPRKVVDH